MKPENSSLKRQSESINQDLTNDLAVDDEVLKQRNYEHRNLEVNRQNIQGNSKRPLFSYKGMVK